MADKAPESFISTSAADALIAAHDGDVALLYIYRTRTGCADRERAARDLCRTLREIDAASEKLERLGLGKPAAPSAAVSGKTPQAAARIVPPAPVEELPEYRTEDLIRRSRSDGEFAAIIAEAARVMGRALSSVDMKTLFGIYDYLGLPADVIMLLINYCGRRYEERYGMQRRPSARAIEKEAFCWVNREVVTVEQAEQFIRAEDARRSTVSAVKDALGIKGRELTKTENDYVSSWLDMGYGTDAISIAYDRTVTNTGALKWSYMNKIILSWKEKGLLTPQEIEEQDSRQHRAEKNGSKRGSRPEDFKGLDSLLDKI